jgi:hypothetical protein
MTLATEMMWDANPSRSLCLPAIRYDRAVALAAVVGAGVAFSMWSMATMATLHTVETSIFSAARILPESSLLPGTVALVDPLHRIAQLTRASASHIAAARFDRTTAPAAIPPASGRADDGRSARFASMVVREGKEARLAPARGPRLKRVAVPVETPLERQFDKVVVAAALTPEKRAAAFARPARAAAEAARTVRLALASPDTEAASIPFGEVPTPRSAPAGDRFGGTLPDRAPVPGREPAPGGTLPTVAEVEKSARVALAVVGSAQSDDTDIPTPTLPASAPAPSVIQPSGDARDDSGDTAQDAFADAMPDSVPVPAKRPELDSAVPSKPSGQKPGVVLAYAKPDEPVEREQPKPKFALPGAGSGVAVYDIKAATVYMPNGDRLEAHSGMGSFTDKPRYVDEKNRGPTPPNVYALSMREKLFHGVPAIRLTPVGDKKMYGRVGFLAHTYMLRGHYAQSNGCVVFKDYQKFLRAFKRGKITKLVVVPSLKGHSASLFAEDDNRWNSFRSSKFNRGA